MYDDTRLSLTIFLLWLAIVIITNRRDVRNTRHNVE